MCGIVGMIGNFDKASEQLRQMNAAIRHRGPDQDGEFIDPKSPVWLGHRRLNILDLSQRARQPMVRDGVVITFNGEIYNFQQLKEELEPEFCFQTTSDTEVLIYGYIKWGIPKLLDKIRGMFAFALYDRNLGKVFLVRDRMGEKPLFYLFNGSDRFAFSSELKAFRYLEEAQQIDFNHLDLYFTLGYVPSPHCIIKNVTKVMPGQWLELSLANFNFRTFTYWKIDPRQKKISMGLEEARDQLDRLIDASVNRSLHSDVPLGIFLSGGIDSSCIAYYAHKHLNCSSQTFSVVYRDPSFDESRYSTLVARHLQTRHHELLLKIEDAKETINHLDEFMDEPLSDMSLIPTYLLSRLTRQFVTVALGGDGADELFLGYPTHTAHLLTRSYNRLPGFIRQNGIQPLVKRLPASHKDFSLDFQLKRFVSSANLSPLLRHFSWQAHIPFEQREELYHQPFDSTGNLMGFLNPRLPRNIDSVPRLIEYLDLKFYLPNDILAKVDTASMANSLEVRSPFLDADVVRFVYSLPVNLKYRLFRQKFLLKKLAEKFLPRKVVYRKKHGFGIPIGRWLKEDLYGHAEGLLSKKRLENIPQLQFGFVRKLLDQHRSGHQNHRKSIWSLMVLSSWLQSYYHV